MSAAAQLRAARGETILKYTMVIITMVYVTSWQVIQSYLLGRARQHDVLQYVEVDTQVRLVTFNDDTQLFTVHAHHLDRGARH